MGEANVDNLKVEPRAAVGQSQRLDALCLNVGKRL